MSSIFSFLRLLFIGLRLVFFLMINVIAHLSSHMSISNFGVITSGFTKIYTGIAAFCAAFAASAAPYLYVNDYSARCGAHYIMTMSWMNFIQSGTVILLLLWIRNFEFGDANHIRDLVREIDCMHRSIGSNGGIDDDALLTEIPLLEEELEREERRLKLESALRIFVIAISLFMFVKTFQSISQQIIDPPQVINEDRCKSWIGEKPSDIPTPIIIILDKNLQAM